MLDRLQTQPTSRDLLVGQSFLQCQLNSRTKNLKHMDTVFEVTKSNTTKTFLVVLGYLRSYFRPKTLIEIPKLDLCSGWAFNAKVTLSPRKPSRFLRPCRMYDLLHYTQRFTVQKLALYCR